MNDSSTEEIFIVDSSIGYLLLAFYPAPVYEEWVTVGAVWHLDSGMKVMSDEYMEFIKSGKYMFLPEKEYDVIIKRAYDTLAGEPTSYQFKWFKYYSKHIRTLRNMTKRP